MSRPRRGERPRPRRRDGGGDPSSLRAGAAWVVAVDCASGMLAVDADARPPAVVGDARSLPLRAGAFDVVVAAFALNHLADPVAGMAEAARMVGIGGSLVASSYGEDQVHPAKTSVDAAARARGWQPSSSFEVLRRHVVPRLATVDRMFETATRAGLSGAVAQLVRVEFPQLDAADLVNWRMGMAHMAPFVARLDPHEQAALAADALAGMGTRPPTLVRSMIVLTWQAPG